MEFANFVFLGFMRFSDLMFFDLNCGFDFRIGRILWYFADFRTFLIVCFANSGVLVILLCFCFLGCGFVNLVFSGFWWF